MYDDHTRRYDVERYQRYPDETYSGQRPRPERPRTEVDAGKLWAGAVATAVVAVLTAFVGLLIARGIFELEVLAPDSAGLTGDASTGGLAALAALGALVAAGLMHLLLISTPSPQSFFSVIVGLVTVLVALQPFLTEENLADKIASMLIYAATGAVIGILLNGVANYAARQVVYTPRAPGYSPDQPRDDPGQTRRYR